MSESMLIAIFNLIAKVGFDAAIAIMDGLKNVKNIDDAITALHLARSKTWEDYKAEAAANLNPPKV